MNSLESRMTAAKNTGRKLLIPYVTGGVTEHWTDLLHAAVDAGADAIEIGLPFSDPTMDGPVVQAASHQALTRGVTTRQLLDELSGLDLPVPLIAFTYANLVLHDSAEAFCTAIAAAGMSGMILPDIPVDEAQPISHAAARHGLDHVLLASPATTPQRRAEIAAHSRGFIYAISVMAPTGEQAELHDTARPLVTSVREITDLPVVLGFGISGARQAGEAGEYADGVAVGSALMRRVLDGAGPAELKTFLGEMRSALDRSSSCNVAFS